MEVTSTAAAKFEYTALLMKQTAGARDQGCGFDHGCRSYCWFGVGLYAAPMAVLVDAFT